MKKYLYGLLVAFLSLTACSPAVATTAPTALQTATAAPTATPAPTLTPTATAEPTKPAIDPASNFPTGNFVDASDELSEFRFNETGRWAHYYDGFRAATGTFRVEGDNYIQTGLNAPCPVPMTYKFSFDGTNLKFELTEQSREDSCNDRKQRYNNTTYILSE